MLDKQRLRSFLLGGLTGVLAGILLAPKSGKETRGTIADRAGEAREKGRERYFDTQESMRERFSANRDGTPVSHREPREETVSPRGEPTAEEVRERPVLRDVSRDVPPEDGGGGGETSRSEELRRKVRETRERLRSRAVGSKESDARGGDDEK